MALHSQTIGFQAKCVADSRIYYDFDLRVEEVSIDPINNRSEIFYTCTAQQSGITFTGTTRSVAATITIVINTESRSFNVALKKTAEGNFRGGVSGTIYIYHSGNGTYSSGLKFQASASRGGGNYGNDPWTYEAKGAVYGSIPLTSIDRTAGTPTISNVSSTYNSASCNITVPFASTVNQYSRDGSNWTNWNKSVSANSAFSNSWSGLSPNTTYKFYYRFRRDYNQVWSPVVSFTVTTKKPATGNANTITYSASTSPTSITISMAGGTPGAGGSVSYYRIKWNGASSYSKVSNPAVFGGLTPDTSYSFSIDFVDNYGTAASGSVSGTASTVLPSTPTKGVISARSVTDTSALVSWLGFGFGSGGTWGKYQYKIGSGSWVDYSNNQNLFLTGLTPNTQYTVYVKLVDNFGAASDAASVTFTTQEKKKWASGSVFIKVDGVWKRGTVYYKSNNAWVKYNGAFIKKEN